MVRPPTGTLMLSETGNKRCSLFFLVCLLSSSFSQSAKCCQCRAPLRRRTRTHVGGLIAFFHNTRAFFCVFLFQYAFWLLPTIKKKKARQLYTTGVMKYGEQVLFFLSVFRTCGIVCFTKGLLLVPACECVLFLLLYTSLSSCCFTFFLLEWFDVERRTIWRAKRVEACVRVCVSYPCECL